MAATADETANPFKITGGAVTSSTRVTDKEAYLKFITWYQPTTSGHLLSVKDKEGVQIAKRYCDIANKDIDIPVFSIVNGIYVDDMDSGEVYFYIR